MSQRDTKLIGGVYRIGQVVSRQGPLTTYTGYDRNTNDVVGLFVIEIPPTFQPQAAQQIIQPLARRQQVQSPHVLRIHDWGIDGTHAYIITDPPRGTTLHYILSNEDVDLRRTLDLLQQIGLGLKALHEHGVAALDLRPNLITIDTVGVADRVQLDDIGLRILLNGFGAANRQQSNEYSSLDPRYAPPEYLVGGPVGPWSDIYQVGLLLFEIVTGRLPFVGHNPAETGIMQTNDPVPRMNTLKHDAPPALQVVVDRALAKPSAQRYENIDALLRDLAGIQVPTRSSLPLSTVPNITAVQPIAGTTTEMTPLTNFHAVNSTTAQPKATATPSYGIPSEEGVYAYLCFERDGEEKERIAIRQENVIVGRLDPKRGLSPDIDLGAFDPRMTVSRQHARIRFEKMFFYLEDLKSRNKTCLGELILTPLQPELLHHGAHIRFGSVEMTFKVPGMKDTTHKTL